MVEVPLDAVKVPASGGIVDAVPAAAVVHDLDEGAAVGGTSPKIWTKQLVKITCPKFGTIWPVGKLLSTIHAGEQQMGVVPRPTRLPQGGELQFRSAQVQGRLGRTEHGAGVLLEGARHFS